VMSRMTPARSSIRAISEAAVRMDDMAGLGTSLKLSVFAVDGLPNLLILLWLHVGKEFTEHACPTPAGHWEHPP
jgi:hypothetical protein